jgi:hypothetical protein
MYNKKLNYKNFVFFFSILLFVQKKLYICKVEQQKRKQMEAIEKEYDLIFRDKDLNELKRVPIWCYSIVQARNYAKIELANCQINDCKSIIVKRVAKC